MPWSNDSGNGQNPWGGNNKGRNRNTGPQSNQDLDEFFRQAQERIKSALGGGSGNGGSGKSQSFNNTPLIITAVAVAGVFWALSGFYRVEPDEAGVELVFGQVSRISPPGLNYVFPSPIGTAITPKVTTVNRTDIGGGAGNEMRRTQQQSSEESQMLTGDENIVDVDLAVFWVVKTEGTGVADYLFNIKNPQGTVKAVAESAMREVIGRNKISAILTEGRQKIESEVQDLIQKTLDTYKAGIIITQVQMQKVDPPAQVIDSFRDVQAARADQERLRNEAATYRNKIVPEARGEAEKIRLGAEGYLQKVVNDAKGQADRFSQVLEEYKKAPSITRERLYIETMERVFTGTEKTIVDNNAGVGDVVPYLPLEPQRRAPTSQTSTQTQRNIGVQ